MKDSLAPGIERTDEVTINDDMGVSHLGAGPTVLATPEMIWLMENTCMHSVVPHLSEDQQTVGTMVHIWHKAAAKIGETVQVSCKLLERDRRKLLFSVQVLRGETVIGEGTHERFVVDLNRFREE